MSWFPLGVNIDFSERPPKYLPTVDIVRRFVVNSCAAAPAQAERRIKSGAEKSRQFSFARASILHNCFLLSSPSFETRCSLPLLLIAVSDKSWASAATSRFLPVRSAASHILCRCHAYFYRSPILNSVNFVRLSNRSAPSGAGDQCYHSRSHPKFPPRPCRTSARAEHTIVIFLGLGSIPWRGLRAATAARSIGVLPESITVFPSAWIPVSTAGDALLIVRACNFLNRAVFCRRMRANGGLRRYAHGVIHHGLPLTSICGRACRSTWCHARPVARTIAAVHRCHMAVFHQKIIVLDHRARCFVAPVGAGAV